MTKQLRQLIAAILLAVLMLGVLLAVHECRGAKADEEEAIEVEIRTAAPEDSIATKAKEEKEKKKKEKKNKGGKKSKKRANKKASESKPEPPRRSHREENPNDL